MANIITELREVIDYVSIGLQRESYHGDPIDPVDLGEIIRLKEEDHLVDEIVEIKLDTTKEPRIQETDKRNLLIQDAENNGCSHVLIIDSDEYYNKNSFLKALKEIDDNDYEMTYCQYINYYSNSYKHFLVYPFKQGMYVPFVSKTKYRHSFECQDFPLPSDPTRRYVRPYDTAEEFFEHGQKYTKKHYTVDYHIFPWETVKMHHLSWVRANIRKKVNMWSSKTCFSNYNDLIDKAVDVYNNFDLNSTEQTKASLLFNTPNHEVYVRPFPKQYIHPKFDITKRLRPVKNHKRIAIMVLSSTNSEVNLFEKLEDTIRKTWAKDVLDGKYPNIDYWKVIDCHEESHIEEKEHTIYIKNDYSKSNIQQLLKRWIEAYKLLSKKHNYDWILRTNISTWCNIDWINEFLAYETDDSIVYTYKLMSAFYSTFTIYASGAAMLWPTRNMPILINHVEQTDEAILNIACDDVMMSSVWRRRASLIKLSDPNKCFSSLEGQYLNMPYKSINWDNVDFRIPMYQVKTFYTENGDLTTHTDRLNNDLNKMHELNCRWEVARESIDLEELVKDYRINGLDKTISVITKNKKEWTHGGMTDKDKVDAQFSDVMPYNEETLLFLDNKAIENGYRKIKN